jgi:hypothetical protein
MTPASWSRPLSGAQRTIIVTEPNVHGFPASRYARLLLRAILNASVHSTEGNGCINNFLLGLGGRPS